MTRIIKVICGWGLDHYYHKISKLSIFFNNGDACYIDHPVEESDEKISLWNGKEWIKVK